MASPLLRFENLPLDFAGLTPGGDASAIVVLWGHEPINLDELLAEDDAERLAAAQITTAAQLEPVGVARRSLGEIATGTTQRDNPTQTCHISITTG